MRYRLSVTTVAFCLILCVLSLFGCTQENFEQSQSSESTESLGIDDTAAPTTSMPSEEPSDNGAKVSATEEQNLSLMDVGVHTLDTNTEYSFDIDGDGIPDTLELHNNQPYWSCEVLFNGEIINGGDEWTWIGQAHLIRHSDDSVALIYQQNGDDNCNISSIYTFTDGNANKIEYFGKAYSFLTPTTLQLTGPVYYFLGNQAVSIDATINEDFTLTLGNDGWFTVITQLNLDLPEKEYRAIVDIPMLRFNNGEYIDAVLPAGTRVYPQFINEAQTRMIIKTDDGALWMYVRDSAGLHFEEGEELFSGCTYAGP